LLERALYGFRAAASEGDVLFRGSTVGRRSSVFALAYDQHFDARMLRQEGCVILDLRRIVRADDIFVVVKENVFDIPGEQLFLRGEGGIIRMQTTASTASSHPMRPEIIALPQSP
jgi:hypothetical protein